ncbi:MAG: hypothetical protein ACYCXX_13975 [Acidiferrobacter thiooxydans]
MEDFDDDNDMPALPPVTDAQDAGTQDDIAPAPPSGGAPASLRDRALKGLDPGTTNAVILEAADAGVRDRDDSAWLMFRKLRDATDAAAIADRAARRIEAATRAVGQTIFNQTVRAGDDLKVLLAAGIEEKTVEAGSAVVTVINHATQAGAAAIKKAAASLPVAAAQQREEILADWRAALASTAAQEAAHRASKGEWLALGAILFAMIFGVSVGGYVGFHLAPQAWPAAAPPAAVWRFPKRDLNEYAWPATTARVAQRCVAGDVCLELRRR